jgi:xylulokinase
MSKKLLLGYDIGSSSIKASLLDADTGELVASAVSPGQEMKIDSPQKGWAEQHPELWWKHVVLATKKMLADISQQKENDHLKSFEIIGIGISYQMHGLVLVNKQKEVLYPSIIWCDSRAVEIGDKAFSDLGEGYCLSNFLNSPGNFTASKLKWVKDNRPDLYSQIFKIMLPGDYIAMKLTEKVCTTVSGLSEGIFWDFKKSSISDKIINYYGFDTNMLAEVVPTFGTQGTLTSKAAAELGLREGIPVLYRAGDQPNNALSLNVLNPGEVAATAGTSGVIYGVTDKNVFDQQSRVNTFAHVNYTDQHPNKGVLLCINGTGIQYSWIKQNILDNKYSYEEMNRLASGVEIGSEGLLCYPFGNGAERVLQNMNIGCRFIGIDFNLHSKNHLIRSAQEGIVFSFKYGLDIMKNMKVKSTSSAQQTGAASTGFEIIRAGYSNLFQSKVFREAFVNTCNIDLEIYNTDGSQGAARGAGIGLGYYSTGSETFKGLKIIDKLYPDNNLVEKYDSFYQSWKNKLINVLGTNNSLLL